MRNAEIKRKTAETDIALWLELDGTGKGDIDTGVGFLDHMLILLAKHGRFDLVVKCTGDTYVDDHHSVEDIAICLGKVFAEALGDKRGIKRYGDTILPMDEALIMTAIDISGRSYLGFDMDIPTEKVGNFDTELVEEFMLAFVRSAGVTLHIRQMAGTNSHHIIEGTFKSLARTLREAVAIDEKFKDDIPSTKGMLEGSNDEKELTFGDLAEEAANALEDADEYQDAGFDDAGYDADETETNDFGDADTFEDSDDLDLADLAEQEEQADADAFDGDPYEEDEITYEKEYDEPGDLEDFIQEAYEPRSVGLDDTLLPEDMKR